MQAYSRRHNLTLEYFYEDNQKTGNSRCCGCNDDDIRSCRFG